MSVCGVFRGCPSSMRLTASPSEMFSACFQNKGGTASVFKLFALCTGFFLYEGWGVFLLETFRTQPFLYNRLLTEEKRYGRY